MQGTCRVHGSRVCGFGAYPWASTVSLGLRGCFPPSIVAPFGGVGSPARVRVPIPGCFDALRHAYPYSARVLRLPCSLAVCVSCYLRASEEGADSRAVTAPWGLPPSLVPHVRATYHGCLHLSTPPLALSACTMA